VDGLDGPPPETDFLTGGGGKTPATVCCTFLCFAASAHQALATFGSVQSVICAPMKCHAPTLGRQSVPGYMNHQNLSLLTIAF